ncbi:hypothetical protein AaE_001741, partial [Aphanomyces astaci]
MSVWRETDWVPSRSMADKDTDEYEASFLQGKRKKILIVFAAALVVVGTAIGVIVATSTETADASQARGSGELLVGSTGGAVVSEVDVTATDPTSTGNFTLANDITSSM